MQNNNTFLNIISLINSPASWAFISRNIYNYSKDLESVNLIHQRGFLYEEDLFLKLQRPLFKKAKADLIFDIPSNLKKKRNSDFVIAAFVYEFPEISQTWSYHLNKNADLIWIPNKFNDDILKRSGVTTETIITPYGTDFKQTISKTNSNLNNRYQRKPFNFLTICMPQKRKNPILTINAFLKAFPIKNFPDTTLTIKFPYLPGKFPWDISTEDLKESIKDDKRIKIINKIYSREEMKELLLSTQLYLQPSYSEGFGLSILDSLSLGIPVLVNSFGGQLDFCNSDNSIILKSNPKEIKGLDYSNKEKTVIAKEPDIKDFSEKLYRFRTDIDFYIRSYQKTKLLDPKKYNWKSISQTIINKIKEKTL